MAETETETTEETPNPPLEGETSPDASDAPPDLVAIDADFIAEWTGKPKAAESPAQEKGTGAASDDEEDPIASLVKQRYGGDRQAFADSLVQQTNSAARLQDQLARMQERLDAYEAGRGSPEDAFASALAASPEIRQLETEILEIQADTKAARDRGLEIIGLHRKAEREADHAEGALSKADDIDKPELRDKLREARGLVSDLEAEYKEKQRILRENNASEKALAKQRARTAGEVKEALYQESNEQAKTTQVKQKAASDFNAAFLDGAKKYGIAPGSEEGKYIAETLLAHATKYLRGLSEDAPLIDIEALTQKLWEREARVRKLTASTTYSRASAERRETRAPASPRGTRLSADNPFSKLPKETLKDADFWKARASRVVGER